MKIFLKGVASALLCLVAVVTQAQLIIQPAMPRLGIVQKSQLWNLLVINTVPEEFEIRIDLVLQDRQTGRTLMTAQSGLVKLAKGPKQLNEQTVFPVQYRYEAVFANNNQQALLPVGNYLACYSIIRLPKAEPIGRECVAIDVTPLSPPQLIYPANGAEVVGRSPQLSWAPPTPASMFNQLRYDVRVTELGKGQSAIEAVQRNIPLLIMNDVPQQSLAYPASAALLDTGKIYAWQVIAKNGESYAAKSEAWSFTVKNVKIEVPVIPNGSFIKMMSEPATPGYVDANILKIQYFQKSRDSVVIVQITSLKDTKTVLATFEFKSAYGQNYYICKLKKSDFKKGECYEAKIADVNGVPFSARFYIKPE